MKKQLMSETAAAYGVAAILILFALLTSCSGPRNMHRGYKVPSAKHVKPAKTGGALCQYRFK